MGSELQIKYIPLSQLRRWPRNPKQHDLGSLHQSIERFGFNDPIAINTRTGYIIEGHGRVNALQQRKASGKAPPRNVRVEGGEWYVPVIMLDLDEQEAEAYALAHNRIEEIGGWEDEALAQVLSDLAAEDALEGVGWDEDDVDALIQQIAEQALEDAAQLERGSIEDMRPNPRQLPLDVIYTIDGTDCTCCLAVQAGLKYGFRSAQFRVCPYVGQLSGRHAVAFIDNDFKDYDHEQHKRVVGKYQPRYATVRDIMSERQCAEAGIEFYPFEQIMRWAEELENYAENVIVIPKYDCIADIPERYVLGYSVPTSYGGTPMPAGKFRGRRVHLLGGSWKAQLGYLALLGDDVVSLDTNWVQLIANYGQWVMPDGEVVMVYDTVTLTNIRYVALALSFGAIGAKINELYAGRSNPA